MKPVDQEFIHKPEIGQQGDCQRAVIASLLELPISEVPHFLHLSNGDTADYYERLQAFCRSHGMAYLTIPSRSGGGFFGDDGDVYHEIAGPSPRGNDTLHAVVGCNGRIVFDPHPSRSGLAGDPEKWVYSYLVCVSPSKASDGPKLTPEGFPASATERSFRRMLCRSIHGPLAYFDDGEASFGGDKKYRLPIDYMRMTPQEIQGTLLAGSKDAQGAKQ